MTSGDILAACFIAGGFLVQGVTGFGSTIVSLTLAAVFLPSFDLLPPLVILSVVVCGVIAWQDWTLVNKRELFQRIIPGLLLGMLLGFILVPGYHNPWLRRAYGAFVAAFSFWQLAQLFVPAIPTTRTLGAASRWGLLSAAGVIHSIYATAGPMVVLYANSAIEDKRVLRSTLCSLWVILDSVLVGRYFLQDRLSYSISAYAVAMVIPAMLGSRLGDYLHHRLNVRLFRVLVFLLLLLAGVGLIRSP